VVQLEQWSESVAVLTQAPLQLVRPPGHWVVQAPLEQTWPLPQAPPQAPQFCGSLAVETQKPPQAVWPAGQATTQAPPEQV
jgi:hypothetical protein